MAKKSDRIALWKIVLALTGCVLVSPTLFVLGHLAEVHLPGTSDSNTGSQPMFTVGTLLMLLGAAIGLLAILATIWLIYRIHDSRIPAWKKNVDRVGQPKR